MDPHANDNDQTQPDPAQPYSCINPANPDLVGYHGRFAPPERLSYDDIWRCICDLLEHVTDHYPMGRELHDRTRRILAWIEAHPDTPPDQPPPEPRDYDICPLASLHHEAPADPDDHAAPGPGPAKPKAPPPGRAGSAIRPAQRLTRGTGRPLIRPARKEP